MICFHHDLKLKFGRAASLCGALFVVATAQRAHAMPAPGATDTSTSVAPTATNTNAPNDKVPHDQNTDAEADTAAGDTTTALQAPKSAEEKAREATLQEERQRQRKQREAELRELLMGYGTTERTAQDEIIRYIAHQTQVNEKLQRKGAELYGALRDNAVSEDRVYQLLTAYRLTLSRNRENRQKDEDDLNGRINFRAQPRLAALLELAGIIGDGPLNLPLPDKGR